MDQPGTVLELCEGVVEETSVDVFADLCNLLHDVLPLLGEDVGSELSPRGCRDLVVVGALRRKIRGQ